MHDRLFRWMVAIALAAAISGCASLDTPTEVTSVGSLVRERTGAELRWRMNEADAQAIQEAVKVRLEKPLTADAAVQVALLANPQAQRLLDQLDVAVAERAQASLMHNPFLDFTYLKPRNEGSTGLEFGLGFELLGALTLPVRQRIAEAEFAANKLAVAESLVALAVRVRKAWYEAQAARMAQGYWTEAREAVEVAGELAERMHRAGNLPARKLQRQKLFAAEYGMQAEQVQVSAHMAREKLNRLMGLWGTAVNWELAGNLPDLPGSAPDTSDLEQRALEASLKLQATRARLDAQAEKLGLARNTRFLPELEAGYAWNREVGDGAWNSGPSLGLQLPFFDTGAAREQKLRGEFRMLEREVVADSVALRSEARALAFLLASRLRAAQQAQRILGPLSQELTQESVLHFNAMQISLFELLQDRRRATGTAITAIEATRDYWLARTDLDSLLSGVFPDNTSDAASPRMAAGGESAGGH
jgi:outer membrane protein TolC